MAEKRPWKAVGDGLALEVRVTPRGGRDAIDGIDTLADGRVVLKIRVRAAAHDGEATAAALKILAKAAGVAPSRVRLLAGATARIKRLAIAGDGAAIASALEGIVKVSPR